MNGAMNSMPTKMQSIGFNVLANEPLYQAYGLDLTLNSMLISEGFFDHHQMVYYYTLYRSVFSQGKADPIYLKIYLAHSSAGETLRRAGNLIDWFLRNRYRF